VRQFELDAISYVPIEQIRKMLFYYEELKSLHDVPGDLVEFGVWRASTLCFLDGPNSSRTIIGFDTFAGFPKGEAPARARDSECLHLFSDTSLAVVQGKIDDRPGRRLRIVPGHIAETLPKHIETWANRIAMAICDADTAAVTRTILDGIWDRMAPGGRIYFDEYSRDGWSETDGVDAFLRERGLPLKMVRRARNGVPIAYLQVD
jgi:Macrocin-O-methyltransferase (TylF)